MDLVDDQQVEVSAHVVLDVVGQRVLARALTGRAASHETGVVVGRHGLDGLSLGRPQGRPALWAVVALAVQLLVRDGHAFGVHDLRGAVGAGRGHDELAGLRVAHGTAVLVLEPAHPVGGTEAVAQLGP